MDFRTWVESEGNWNSRPAIEEPFSAGGVNYTLRFSMVPTHRAFPYSPYGGGQVAEIVWFPAEQGDRTPDEKYNRTGGNSLSSVRDILRTLPRMIHDWITKNRPVGFFWKGNDARLRSVWERMTKGVDFASMGYVRSTRNQNMLVRKELQPILDEIEGF